MYEVSQGQGRSNDTISKLTYTLDGGCRKPKKQAGTQTEKGLEIACPSAASDWLAAPPSASPTVALFWQKCGLVVLPRCKKRFCESRYLVLLHCYRHRLALKFLYCNFNVDPYRFKSPYRVQTLNLHRFLWYSMRTQRSVLLKPSLPRRIVKPHSELHSALSGICTLIALIQCALTVPTNYKE